MPNKTQKTVRTAGFTLMEILIVVVVALSVTAFAVPVYRKAQLRNNFAAAQGFLLEVYNAVSMCIADQPGDNLSNCISSNQPNYAHLRNPGNDMPAYLQPYNEGKALRGYVITVNGTASHSYLSLKLNPRTGLKSPYSATLTNGDMKITVTK